MAPLKAIAAWYPADRQASYAGWIMVAGGVGALVATVPLELALRVDALAHDVRPLSAVTLVVAVFICLRVPDIDKPAHSGGIEAQFAGVRDVVMHPRFWWIAPLGGLAMGSFMAIQGLWAVPWLMEVEGMIARAGGRPPPRHERRDHGRLLRDRPLRHAARAARHPRTPPVRQRDSRSTSPRSRRS